MSSANRTRFTRVVVILGLFVVALLAFELGVLYSNRQARVVAFPDAAAGATCFNRFRPGWVFPDSWICEGTCASGDCKMQYRAAGSEEPWEDAPQYWRLDSSGEELRCVCP